MRQHLIRNVFNQYQHQENRLTHALVQVLARNPRLTREFLRRFVDGFAPAPGEEILISCQRFPDQESERLPEDEALQQENAGRGIPDFWMYRKSADNGPGWAVICECKVQARLEAEQLRSHCNTAQGLRLGRLYVLTITPTTEPEVVRLLPTAVRASSRTWSEVYEFLDDYRHEVLVDDFLDYMHVIEGELTSEGKEFEPLTKFTGITFDPMNPYSDVVAMSTLRALMKELRLRLDEPNVLAVDTSIRRKPLVSPWDVIGFKLAQGDSVFTRHPHLTVGIGKNEASIQLTLPNAAGPRYWRRIRTCNSQELASVLRAVADRLRPMRRSLPLGRWEPTIILYLQQLHFFARRYEIMDGNLEFDVSASLGDSTQSGVKLVPAWLEAIRSVLKQTPRANFEAALQVRFPYAKNSRCSDAGFVDALVGSAEALHPFLALLVEGSQP